MNLRWYYHAGICVYCPLSGEHINKNQKYNIQYPQVVGFVSLVRQWTITTYWLAWLWICHGSYPSNQSPISPSTCSLPVSINVFHFENISSIYVITAAYTLNKYIHTTPYCHFPLFWFPDRRDRNQWNWQDFKRFLPHPSLYPIKGHSKDFIFRNLQNASAATYAPSACSVAECLSGL